MIGYGDYESDINVLKDIAGGLGEMVGGDLGRAVGEMTYFGFSLGTDVASLAKGAGELFEAGGKLIDVTRSTSVGEVISSGFKTVKQIMFTDVNLNTVNVVKNLIKGDELLFTTSKLVSTVFDGIGAADSFKDYKTGAINLGVETVKTMADQLIVRYAN